MSPDPEARLLANELAAAHDRIAALTAEIDRLRAAHDAALAGQAATTSDIQFHVRNMLAIIRSVFRRTAETGTSLDEVTQHFAGRLDALARRQSFGLSAGSRGPDIEDIVRDELLSVGVVDMPRLTISGPETHLEFRQADLVGLAIHELATNSIKFGALGATDAALAINWNVTADPPAISFEWVETGVSVLAPAPMRTGFGREFIEQALPYQLKAQTRMELRPGGIRCTIVLPLARDTEEPRPASLVLQGEQEGDPTQ